MRLPLHAIPLAAVAGCLLAAPGAFARSSEDKPLNLSDDGGAAETAQASTGGSLVRTILALAFVLGVIYAVHWLLKKAKQAKQSANSGAGMDTIATLSLGTNRSLHLVRVGSEIVLLGAAEHAVTPIRRYSEAEARDLGLLADDDDDLSRPATLADLEPTEPKGFLDSLRARTVVK
jgi:flagellar protein FliO/FliZ